MSSDAVRTSRAVDRVQPQRDRLREAHDAFSAVSAGGDASASLAGALTVLRAAFAECWRVAFDAVADKYGNDAGRRLAGVPADGGYRTDLAVAERLREGNLLGFVRV